MEKAKLDWANNWLQDEKKNYIGGEWRASSSDRIWEAESPSDQRKFAKWKLAGETEVNAAVAAANTAHAKGQWSKMPMRDRARLMYKIAELIRSHESELATLEALSNGKLYKEALLDDLPDCSSVFEYYAGWIDKHYGETCPVEDGFLNYTLKEPVGVCALIVPWNFPLLLACWKIAPALAMGNTVVVKPSEYTPYTLIRLFELIDRHLDLPPGVLNLILGDHIAGDALTAHHGVHKVSFTGSTAVGQKIVQNSGRSNLKSVSLELGGKSPNIMFADVPDLDFAIARSYHLTFSQKGEKCSEPTRLIVHDKIYDRVVSDLAGIAEKIKCGGSFADGVDQGAQCNRVHFEKIKSFLQLARDEKVTVLAGGDVDSQGTNAQGYFIRPTIYADVDQKSRLVQEEIFGPVLVVSRFKSDEEAVQLANDSTYGLAAGLWTADVSRAHRVASQLEAGMVFINRYGCYDFSSPFGGFKMSGWGKEMAKHSLESYTKTKSVWLKI